jgi:hypothetical protein
MAAATVSTLLVVTGCSNGGDNSSSTGATSTATAATGSPQSLRGVCPDRIVFQKDWQPESEHGVLYNLVGANPTIDTNKKKVIGQLVSEGVDTGVQIEIRTGGPAVGFQPVPALMYLDKAINIGFVATDESIQYSANQPTTAIVAQLDVSPLAIIWDKKEHPDFNSIADVGQTDTPVLYTQGLTYMSYLTGAGILRQSQLNGSYTGAPDLFLQSKGKAAIQGFATSEPYLYEKEIKAWGRPMDFQLVNDTGYPSYFSSMSIRSGDKEKLAPCLKKLVPILQRSQVEFVQSPDRAIKLIVDLVKKYNTGWVYSEALAKFSAEQMRTQGIVANGNDKTLGNFDQARLEKILKVCVPIFTSQKKATKPGLTPDDIATNEFIDPGIGLPASK